VTLSPDQSLLYVCDTRSHGVYSYQIQPDGLLKYKQKYGHLHQPDTADDSGADGMRCDRDGRLYVATRMGVQVCDQAGRVTCILPTPNGRVAIFVSAARRLTRSSRLAGTRCSSASSKRAASIHPLAPSSPPHRGCSERPEAGRQDSHRVTATGMISPHVSATAEMWYIYIRAF